MPRCTGTVPDDGDLVAQIDNALDVIDQIDQKLARHVECAAFRQALFGPGAILPYALVDHVVRGRLVQFSPDL